VNTGKDKTARRLNQERVHMHARQSFGMNTPSPIIALSQQRHTVDRTDEQLG
jgi:hypothetical protein